MAPKNTHVGFPEHRQNGSVGVEERQPIRARPAQDGHDPSRPGMGVQMQDSETSSQPPDLTVETEPEEILVDPIGVEELGLGKKQGFVIEPARPIQAVPSRQRCLLPVGEDHDGGIRSPIRPNVRHAPSGGRGRGVKGVASSSGQQLGRRQLLSRLDAKLQ